MERITKGDLSRISETVSEGLPESLSVRIQGRNGYTGCDLYDGESMRDTLTIGTKREVYTYLQGMRQAHLLAEYGA